MNIQENLLVQHHFYKLLLLRIVFLKAFTFIAGFAKCLYPDIQASGPLK